MPTRWTVIILGIVVFGGGLIGCEYLDRIKKPAVTANQKSISLNALEQAIYQQVNEYRQSRNLPPLTVDASINEQSKLHSQAMASGKVPFSHQGFDDRVDAIAKSISYRSAAENVAFNEGYSDPATQAVKGWLNSPGHRKNIEGNFDLTGVGVVKNAEGKYYFTQIFIRRSPYGF